ncbi:DUF6163 family protein [Bartonella senegalensis]|uniref:DUF6163 family protein n=1 Tax=Bartonella senegalensis TaxID=1468418 RepID=UPI0003194646|nr:DUF6163 family protein [Bartonella senegalensis]
MINNSQKKISKIHLIYNCYLRLLALVCLGLGVFYWIRLVGVFPGALWRFDLMPWQWQCLSATLAIVYPIALIGLWMYSLWGVILWCIAAFGETFAMIIYYSDYPLFLPVFHGILLLIFITLQIIRQINKFLTQ